MSYPYVEYEGYKFSLIEPFTVNDKLITKISIDGEHDTVDAMCDGRIMTRVIRATTCIINIQLHTGERFGFQLSYNFNDDAECTIKNILRDYMYNRHNYINPYVARECRHSLNEDINHLLIDVQRQCEHCYGGYSLYSYNNELIRQGRPGLTSDYDRFNFSHINIDRIVNSFANCGSVTISCDSFTSQSEKDKIIHSHSYRPEYKKHLLSGENESTTLLLGAEIEVDNGGRSEEHAKKVLEIMNGTETWNSEENIYCVHDGSLRCGLEFPTQPGSLAWHKTLPYKEMFEYLDKNGYKAHDTTTCGLHIHINRSFFGEKESECIGKLMYIIEKFNNEFSILGRRDCRYAKLLGYNGEKCKELYQKGYQNRDKYNAVNLLHTNTIEIRSFKGTLKYSTFINTLEFISDLAWFVKNHTEEEVEHMDWSDLYLTFSDELKKYYDEREKLESEKRKTEKNKEEELGIMSRNRRFFPSINFHNNGTVYISHDRNSEFVGEVNSLSVSIDTESSYSEPEAESDGSMAYTTPRYERGLRSDISWIDDNIDANSMRDIIEAISNSNLGDRPIYNMSTIMSDDTILSETNEKKLKRLKKQLKTEQNYMTKQDLKRQIQELQKEIKQEKKRNKRNERNNVN